jgi:glyoxylase-like metal-dependent hydrolase (beta-lactamase superfamily II)/Flp pilus assembly protein TadD
MRTMIRTILVGVAILSIVVWADCLAAFAKTAIEQGEEACKKRDYDTAIRLFTEAIQANPKDAAAFHWRGVAYWAKDANENAIADFTEAIRLKPDFAKAYRDRAKVHFNDQKNDAALADLNESIRLDPNDADARSSRGILYEQRLEQLDKAIADLNEAIRLGRKDALTYLTRGRAYIRNRDTANAIADYSEAIRLSPKDASIYYHRGLAYVKKKDMDKATADFAETIRLDPNNLNAQRYIAQLRKIQGLSDQLNVEKNLEKAKNRLAAIPEQKKTQAPGFYRMMLGNVEITALFDGIVDLDTALLQNISPEEINTLLKRAMIDDPHKIPASTNAYLVNTGVKLVLIDAGGGKAFPGLGHLIENLKASGYKSEEVDAVLITHLHPDHVAGLIGGDGKPVYSKAVVYVAKAENDYWLSDAEPEVPAVFKEHLKKARKQVRDTAKPYLDSKRWRTFDEGKLPILGIKAVAIPGHSPGHTAYEIQSAGQKLLVIGDTIHVGAIQFAKPDAAVSFDSDPKKAVATREALFQRITDGKTFVADMHVAFPGIGRIRADGKNSFGWVPIDYTPLPPSQEPSK